MEEHNSEDQPGEAELRPLLREALAAMKEMQLDEAARPKLRQFARGEISAEELQTTKTPTRLAVSGFSPQTMAVRLLMLTSFGTARVYRQF